MDNLEILLHDDDLVVVNKPAGLLVHRSEIDRRETRFALQIVRDQIGQHLFPVHRLDKPTSGVLVFALSHKAARQLNNDFTQNRVQKTYLAIVRGHPDAELTVNHSLQEVWDKMTDRGARRDKPPQSAITRVRRLATGELPVRVDRYPTSRYALVEARPLTGRRHQIRRHMKHLSHPIIGDTTYGKSRHNRLFTERFDCTRLLLHASELVLPHPGTRQPLALRAPLDEPFYRTVDALGWTAQLPAP